MPQSFPSHYTQLMDLMRDIGALHAVINLANWDQETYMPPGAASARAEQASILAALKHERATSPRLRELLDRCEADKSLSDPASETGANLREIRRDFDMATKLPTDLVAEIAKAASESQEVWRVAREKNDFKSFQPYLERMIGLMRRKAECRMSGGRSNGQKGELYDALLDEYEPGMTAREVEAVFTPLRAELTKLVADVRASKTKVSTKCLKHRFDEADQHRFGMFVLEAMGFDLQSGRLDTTAHPFCTDIGAGDTRLTTRYRNTLYSASLSGTMHEGGHGLYEQGLRKSEYPGQPLAESISLGIHESQSRMWENFVGRSKAFWKWALPASKKFFGKKLLKHDPEEMFRALNTVKPSFIRVEADEGTYNQHVMIRFEIERELIAGRMSAQDVPGEWNRRYKDVLGVDVPDDTRGCLQDVHWSFALVGYFPTYTLGNLYAAQMWEKINEDIPDLTKQMGKGKFRNLLSWLRTHVHQPGRRYKASELCQRITGKPLSSEPLLKHLRTKAETVYGIGG